MDFVTKTTRINSGDSLPGYKKAKILHCTATVQGY